MLRFRVFQQGAVPPELDLSTAYLCGADNVPIRAEFAYVNGEIQCRKRASGPAALTLLWDVPGFGRVMLETTRLPERDTPYLLNLELARGRMMRFFQKREDWGLYDLAEAQPINDKINTCRDLLMDSLTALDDLPASSRAADACLAQALPVSEQAALIHADVLLQRRISVRNFPKGAFGTRIEIEQTSNDYRRLIIAGCDFAQLPMRWRDIEPQEQDYQWQRIDEWAEYLRRAKLPVVGGPLVQFSEASVPDWLYIWEHDYETVRDLLYEHIERVVSRYGSVVSLWNVVSALHVNAQFSFTFDQLMDLTRMAIGQVRKLHPKARTMIELTQPWGEYYATNQRSIPPLLYGEMIAQSGISFDILALQIRFGMPKDGAWQRDLFQLSAMLDRFAPLLASAGPRPVPLMLSCLQVPSQTTDTSRAAGEWRGDWTETLQSKWMQAVVDLALSKPFVEAISWGEFSDQGAKVPHGGLAKADLAPKLGFRTWGTLRRAMQSFRKQGGSGASMMGPPSNGESAT